ncbi:mRNA-capping enzyme subunit beta [Glugoides intestinalis]
MFLPEVLFKTRYESGNPFRTIINKYLKRPSYKEIEIEARVGKITNKLTAKRIEFETEHPIIFNPLPSEFHFENGVEEKDYAYLKNLVFKDADLVCKNDKVIVSDKVRCIISEDSVLYEKKARIKTLDIYLPAFKYDVRISISKETKVSKSDFKNKSPSFTRTRERESGCFGPFSFDFTKSQKLVKEKKTVYEVELEIKDPVEGLDEFLEAVFNLPVIK